MQAFTITIALVGPLYCTGMVLAVWRLARILQTHRRHMARLIDEARRCDAMLARSEARWAARMGGAIAAGDTEGQALAASAQGSIIRARQAAQTAAAEEPEWA